MQHVLAGRWYKHAVPELPKHQGQRLFSAQKQKIQFTESTIACVGLASNTPYRLLFYRVLSVYAEEQNRSTAGD